MKIRDLFTKIKGMGISPMIPRHGTIQHIYYKPKVIANDAIKEDWERVGDSIKTVIFGDARER